MNLSRLLNKQGFSLIELMVAVAVIGILSAIAVPNFISYKENTKIRNVSRSLVTDLQYVKTHAIRENSAVTIVVTGNDYTICFDDDDGNDCDPGEQVLRYRSMPSGFVITNDFAAEAISFDGKGMARFVADSFPVDEEATITLQSPGGRTANIHVNFLARVRIEE